MAADFDLESWANTIAEYGKSSLYKAFLGDPRPGTSEAQQLKIERNLRNSLQKVLQAQLDRQTQDPREQQSWQANLLNRQSDLEQERRLKGMEGAADIANRSLAGKTEIETDAFGRRTDVATNAANSLNDNQTENQLQLTKADYSGKQGLIGAQYGGIKDILGGQVIPAQQGMFNAKLAAQQALAERMAGLEEKDMEYRHEIGRQAVAQELARSRGVRGFIGDILMPLLGAGASIAPLFL